MRRCILLSIVGVLSACLLSYAQSWPTTRFCEQAAGATTTAKVIACINALPPSGGVADATGFPGPTQTLTSSVFSGVPSTKKVILKLGIAADWTIGTQTLGTNHHIEWDDGSRVNFGACTIFAGVQLQVCGTDAVIGLNVEVTPGNTSDEGAIGVFGYDSVGGAKKISSLSAKWASTNSATGYGVMRLNATHTGGNSDDIFLRGFGNHGATFWGTSDSDVPGLNVSNYPILHLRGDLQVGGLPSTVASGTAGTINLSYGSAITTRNRTNDQNVQLIGMGNFNADDYIEIGDNQQHGVTKPLGTKIYCGASSPCATGVTAGDFSITRAVRTGSAPSGSAGVYGYQMSDGQALTIRNRANTGDIVLIGSDNFNGDDYVEVGDNQQHGVFKPLGTKIYGGGATAAVTVTTGGVTVVPVLTASAVSSNIAGAGAGRGFNFDSLASGYGMFYSTGSAIRFQAGSSNAFGVQAISAAVRYDGIYNWTTTADAGTGTYDTGLSRDSAGIVDVGTGAQGSSAGSIKTAGYLTTTNCSTSGCGAANGGATIVAAAATTVVVSTTAVTANSQIFVTEDSSLSTRLGVTCNTQALTVIGAPRVTARSTGTSFTVSIDVGPTANPLCFDWFIVN